MQHFIQIKSSAMSNINIWQVSKVFLLTLVLITNLLVTSYAQVGINDDNGSPDASAMLDVKSTTKGMLIPRVTTTQRNAISSPATGLIVYNTTTNNFNFYNGTAWIEITTGSDNVIVDADGDTKIQVEKSADEDSIRFDILGSERLVLKQNNSGITMLSLPNTKRNILIGQDAGLNTNLNNILDKGQDNIFIGYQAGKTNTTGYENTFIGHQAGLSNFTGISNIFIGYKTGFSNTTGDFNTFLGDYSGNANTIAGSNTFIGNSTGSRTTTGGLNVFLGSSTGYLNTTGQQNTYIGSLAGLTNTDGERNVYLGFQAGYNATGNDKLYIENSNSNAPLIYGEFNNDLVRINGTLNINNAFSLPTADGTTGQVLTTNGTGTVSWTNAMVNTDNQTIDTIQLNGDTLQLSLSNDSEVTKNIDLSSIGDIPKMTTIQRSTLTSPTVGELIYDTTTKTYWYYENNRWNEVNNGNTSINIEDFGTKYSCIEKVGNIGTGTYNHEIITLGNKAYVRSVIDIKIYDISTPTNPTLIGSYNSTNELIGFKVVGNYIYFVEGQVFKILDISNPVAPTLKGSINISTNSFSSFLDVSGNYAYVYVAFATNSFTIIDISDKNSPTKVTDYNVGNGGHSGAVSGNYAYLSVDKDLKIFDISTPATPSLVGQIQVSANLGIGNVVYSDNRVYMIDYDTYELEIVDVSNPNNPTWLGSIPVTAANQYVVGLTQLGNFVFIQTRGFNAIAGNILKIVDVSDPQNPKLNGEHDFGSTTIFKAAASPTNGHIYIGLGNLSIDIFALCSGLSMNASGQLISSKSSDLDKQTIDVAQLNGNNLELSISNDGETNKSISLSNFKQTIDIAQFNGNNLELSLSNDNQPTQNIDISGIKDNLGNHTTTQNIQLGNYWLSGDGNNEGLNINSAGRVGIGRTPLNGLHNPLSVQGHYAQNTIFNTTKTGGGTYLDILNNANGRMLLGVDGDGFSSSSSTLDGVIGTWSNGGLKFFTSANERVEIKKTGEVRINNAYDLPMVDGVGGHALITDGVGTLYWGEPAFPTSIGILGIGIQATKGLLEVNGVNGNVFMAQYSSLHAGGSSGPHYNHTEQFAIYAHNAFAAPEFYAFSDSRIKNIQGISNSKEDLEQLLKIEITNYQMIDTISEGNQPYKKVIAQQVKEVYPQAVNTDVTRAIPDIYQMATVENGWIVLENNFNIGERIKIITGDNDGIYEIVEVEPTRFKVGKLATRNPQPATVFIYGREVSDFHTVDYEAIAMLNVSTTQQLAKENQNLKKRLEALKIQASRINELQNRLQFLQQQLPADKPTTNFSEK